MGNKTKGNLILLLTAALWGTGFISQKLGNEILPPMMFNAIRQLMAVAVMFPIAAAGFRRSRYLDKSVNQLSAVNYRKKRLLLAGLFCGGFMLAGTMTQQIGLVTVDAGKSGFISDLYIVIVPLFSLAIGEKVRLRSVLCIGIAMIGFAVMSLKGGLGGATVGDWLTLASAVAFAGQIVSINYFVDKDNAIMISAIQSLVVGSAGLVMALMLEETTLASVWQCMPVLIYQTLVPTAMGFTFQIVGQRYTDASTAALILSTEAIFAAIFGAVFLGETMSVRELAGSAIIFAAIILGQLEPSRSRKPDAAP